MIVRTRVATRRDDGSYVRFDRNALVLILITTTTPAVRAFSGPCPASCAASFSKIISLAAEVV